MERFLLDTHIWIWLQEADRTKLKRKQFEDAEIWLAAARLCLSAISIWEVAQLAARKRITLSIGVDAWVQHAIDDPLLQWMPLERSILIESTRLPASVHKDPADRMLIATAREADLTLLTRDDDILAYAAAGHVRAKKF